MNTVLHIPLNKDLKIKAENTAKKKGYSSLQEVLRVFIVQFTDEQIKPAFISAEGIVQLTLNQERYLSRRSEEIKKAAIKGDAYSVRNVDEMMNILDNIKYEG